MASSAFDVNPDGTMVSRDGSSTLQAPMVVKFPNVVFFWRKKRNPNTSKSKQSASDRDGSCFIETRVEQVGGRAFLRGLGSLFVSYAPAMTLANAHSLISQEDDTALGLQNSHPQVAQTKPSRQLSSTIPDDVLKKLDMVT